MRNDDDDDDDDTDDELVLTPNLKRTRRTVNGKKVKHLHYARHVHKSE